jgi:hypothetical protein
MRTVMVSYQVKPDRVSENEELVRAVYEELARTQPDGFRYATFKLDDGVGFVHLAALTDCAESPLAELASFRRFQQQISERCEQQPVVRTLSPVGSFGLLEAISPR